MAQDTTKKREREEKRQFDTGGGMHDQLKTSVTAERGPVPTDTNNNVGDSGSDSESDTEDRVIRFPDSNLDDDGTTHVFSMLDNTTNVPKKITFTWNLDDKEVKLNKIELFKVDDRDTAVRFANFPGSDASKQPGVGEEENDFFEEVSADSSSAELNFAAFETDTEMLDFEDFYAVRLKWSREGSDVEGESISPYFTVTEQDDEDRARQLEDELLNEYPEATTGTEDDGSGNTRGGSDSAPSSGYPNAGETDSADPEDSDVADSDSNGGGGLAPGTIAGIVVGVVVFLALVGGLVFFLLRRRRKTKRSGGAYADAGDNSNAYIVDKIDTSAQSPRSPYSDDGHEQHTPLDPQAHHNFRHQEPAAAAGEGSNGSEYAGLYQASQHQHQHESAPRAVDDNDNAAQQSSPRMQSRSNTGNYSHLVEEGMTADDIRRLEEEERQLDDEIARAGRR